MGRLQTCAATATSGLFWAPARAKLVRRREGTGVAGGLPSGQPNQEPHRVLPVRSHGYQIQSRTNQAAHRPARIPCTKSACGLAQNACWNVRPQRSARVSFSS